VRVSKANRKIYIIVYERCHHNSIHVAPDSFRIFSFRLIVSVVGDDRICCKILLILSYILANAVFVLIVLP
jgi:hypothetical protein